jgi:hypothetical protein
MTLVITGHAEGARPGDPVSSKMDRRVEPGDDGGVGSIE